MIKVTDEIYDFKYPTKGALQAAFNELGNPQNDFPVINVVGTNGKGSTSFYLSKGLLNQYQKVGLFISPAFLFHNERIQINNEPIKDDILTVLFAEQSYLIEKYQLNFFEAWTLICALYFKQQNVDIAVIEAGIGGEKDSTALFSNQLLVLLTSIGLDHLDLLGDSIEQIIDTKVKITKPSRTIIISDDNLIYIREINSSLKTIKNVKLIAASQDSTDRSYQKYNKGLVAKALTYLNIKLDEANLFMNKPPLGRFTILKDHPYFIIDGAHNSQGLERVLGNFKKLITDAVVVLGFSKGRDYQALVDLTRRYFAEVFVVNFDSFKAQFIKKVEHAILVDDWKKTLQNLVKLKRNILVCGSLYLIPQVYEWFTKER